jgi:hypothetical protein
MFGMSRCNLLLEMGGGDLIKSDCGLAPSSQWSVAATRLLNCHEGLAMELLRFFKFSEYPAEISCKERDVI